MREQEHTLRDHEKVLDILVNYNDVLDAFCKLKHRKYWNYIKYCISSSICKVILPCLADAHVNKEVGVLLNKCSDVGQKLK